MQNKGNFLGNIIYTIIVIFLLILFFQLCDVYKINNFNDFIKTEYTMGVTKFTRDEDVKYDDYASYKITSTEFNDAIFYKSIKVNKNTPYKITCMVKTENVENEFENSNAGANISIAGSVEKSRSIIGTNDWQKLELIVNSKNRDMLNVGFRLGAYTVNDNSKGTAWFSNFTIEEGYQIENNNWHFAYFIIPEVNVTINGENSHLYMSNTDMSDIQNCIRRFENSLEELTENKMRITYDLILLDKPLTTLSFDENNGYFISENDVYDIIDEYVQQQEYDHIFVVARLNEKWSKKDKILTDWVGLGSMTYGQIGFSNIRVTEEENNYVYKYDLRRNQFPEEVMIHEFIHSLERTCREYGNEVINLHDYEQYGYENEKLIGLKKWYNDYLLGRIDGNLGLNQEVFQCQPAHNSDFKYSLALEDLDEPDNVFEKMNILVRKFILLFKDKLNIKEQNVVYESIRI